MYCRSVAISSGTLDGAGRYPVVPFDLDGKSIYLGAPIHFLIDGLVTTDFVLHEPLNMPSTTTGRRSSSMANRKPTRPTARSSPSHVTTRRTSRS